MPPNAETGYDVLLAEGKLPDGSICWTAQHPQLPGCNATGRNEDEALENLAKSREAWLKVAADLTEDVPNGSDHPVFTTMFLPVPGANRLTAAVAINSQMVPA